MSNKDDLNKSLNHPAAKIVNPRPGQQQSSVDHPPARIPTQSTTQPPKKS